MRKTASRRRRSKRHRILPVLSLAAVVLIVWSVWGNTALMRTDVDFVSPRVPQALDGLVIAHVSDLHDAEIGEDNRDILEMVLSGRPDIILLTGDMVDSNRGDIDRSLSLCEKLSQIAPTYYVSGNHEASLSYNEYHRFTKGLKEADVTVLEDESCLIDWKGTSFQLIGTQDIGFIKGSFSEKTETYEQTLSALVRDDLFTVLLAHRPELVGRYAACGVDLVLCGHSHGGQIRLPLIGGLYAPGQGFFPKYDGGLYEEGDTSMEVSRGIGNSNFPLRVNDRPEVVFITLRSAAKEQ